MKKADKPPFRYIRSRMLHSVHLGRQHLAAQTLVGALDGGSQLALSFGSGLFVELAGAQFGQQTGFLDGAFEAAQGDVERLVFFNFDVRHV